MSRPESDIAIRVSNLSKMFKVYQKPSDMFWELFRGKPRHQEFWALRDISFEIRRGQVMGIIGRNGAGKSTLLKIIAGTLDKTFGQVEVNGRISSILELGTGFQGEYTGRENIYLGGMLIGLSRKEIDQKLDWIIEFSELGDFIDQPFKTYSTGMQARLTFSTAVCIEPDILIVDEALSVGDIKFQSKCYAFIQELQQTGCTILLVSHDLNSVKHFCDWAILLENGAIIKHGQAKEVADFYYKRLFSPDDKVKPRPADPTFASLVVSKEVSINSTQPQIKQELSTEFAALKKEIVDRLNLANIGMTDWGNKKAEFLDFGILDEQDRRTTILESGKNYYLFSYLLFYEDIDDISLGIVIRNEKGVDLFRMNSHRQQVNVPSQKKGCLLETRIKVTMWLAPGDYLATFGVVKHHADPSDKVLDGRMDAYHFKVIGDCLLDPPTVVNLLPQWSLHSYNPRDDFELLASQSQISAG